MLTLGQVTMTKLRKVLWEKVSIDCSMPIKFKSEPQDDKLRITSANLSSSHLTLLDFPAA